MPGRDGEVAHGAGAPAAGDTCSPVATTCRPAGAAMRTSKSAVGDVDVSLGMWEGGSSAQPRPGTHGSTGKNEPSRSSSPCWEMRSRALYGIRSGERHRDRRRPAGRQPAFRDHQRRRVGQPRPSPRSAVDARRGRWRGARPPRRRLPPFAHSRNTIRSVAMSGVNSDLQSPADAMRGRCRAEARVCSAGRCAVGRRVGWAAAHAASSPAGVVPPLLDDEAPSAAAGTRALPGQPVRPRAPLSHRSRPACRRGCPTRSRSRRRSPAGGR